MVFRKLFLLVFMTLAVCTGGVYADLQHPCSSSYPCSAGSYCDNGSCEPCHVGNYCVNNNEYECSRNTYTALEGQSSCQTCPSDMPYANEQHIYCTPCSGGAFIVEDWVCVACPSGQYANPEHTECLTNCDNGTVEEGVCQPNQQTECDPGAYLNTNGECLECSAGYYCVGGQAGMQICPKDTYSSAAQSECTKCPDGYVTESEGTGYVVGADLTNICKKQKTVLKIGKGTETLPVYLREGRINRAVVRVKNN
ncbi:MAG: hypothetical protein II843_01175 [Alphaproteobacteria bacterium]|nr:hypothetical protein [Alphaproteobacteria bacterium]